MSRAKGSRFILGHLGYADLAALEEGQAAVVMLNPSEPNARFEVSKNLKAAFYRRRKCCRIETQLVLVQVEPGAWREGHMLTVTALPTSV